TYDQWEFPWLIFSNVWIYEISRVSINAAQKKRKGAWIIAAGSIAYFICWIMFTLIRMGILDPAYMIVFNIVVIMFPLTLSIYLGYEFAMTSKSLEQKLSEVKVLSEEKQQILTSQNETLETQVKESTAH